MENIKPKGTRIIVKILQKERFEKNKTGFIVDNNKEVDTKFQWATLIEVSDSCVEFSKHDIGTELFFSRFAGVELPQEGLKILDEKEIYAYKEK